MSTQLIDEKASPSVSIEKDFSRDTKGSTEDIPIDTLSHSGLDQTTSNSGGAPTERVSALGTQTGWISVIFLNINMMIGSGVFSTGGSLLKTLGSPGIVLMLWLFGIVISFSGLAIYLELASMFPQRGGAEVVYLEQAYKRPKYFFPAAFAALSVLLSFSSSNAIVLANYLLYASGNDTPDKWLTRGIAVAGYTVAAAVVLASTKWSLRFSNLLGFIKTGTLIFIAITGFVVLSGKTRVMDPHMNFRHAFSGTIGDGNAVANALVKINFSFAGYTNAMNVANEIPNPTRTLGWAAPASLAVVSVLYVLANVAYFAAVPAESIKKSGTLVAGLFFTEVFGRRAGARVLPGLIAVSAFGNLIAVLHGQSRVIREIGRQGVLPYTHVWVSTWPFGTPLVPLLLKWVLTCIVIVAPPPGDAFNFIVGGWYLASYPDNVFSALVAFGIFIIRRERIRKGVANHEFHAWNAAVIFSCAMNLFLLVVPWVPPKGGIYGGDVSFLYCLYCIVGVGLLAACYIYWYIWIKALPRYRGYTIVDETVHLADGSSFNRLNKVWNKDL